MDSVLNSRSLFRFYTRKHLCKRAVHFHLAPNLRNDPSSARPSATGLTHTFGKLIREEPIESPTCELLGLFKDQPVRSREITCWCKNSVKILYSPVIAIWITPRFCTKIEPPFGLQIWNVFIQPSSFSIRSTCTDEIFP